METRKLFPLPDFCRQQKLPYEHVRQLAGKGLFPVVHLGRRLYVHEDEVLAWIRRGGAAIPGQAPQAVATPQAAAGVGA